MDQALRTMERNNRVGVGIDMGGTMIKIGLVHDGLIISNTRLAADAHVSLHERLNEVGDAVDALLQQTRHVPMGIGLAFPGIVDVRTNRILSDYVKYPDARALDLSAWAQQRWGLPLVVENDARAALLGEWQYGAGRGCNSLVLVTLGTGFGSAALMEGHMLRGKHQLAGNLGGHMTLNLHGKVCNCGNIGCLESECSSWALEQHVREMPGFAASIFNRTADVSFRAVFAAARQGDAFALQVLEHCLKTWSLGIISLIHAYDPERVILGGGIMQSGDIIIPHVQNMVARHSWVSHEPPDIVSAGHVEFAAILGLYHLLAGIND